MSVLFAKSVESGHHEDYESDEDILGQFNVPVPDNVDHQQTGSPVVSSREASVKAIKGPLRARQKHKIEHSHDAHSRSPYGIPIYDLLESIKKRRVPDEPHSTQSGPKRKKARTSLGQLLCEKYRPQQFFDLVGNDDANRVTLRWLSRWRAVVFGREPELSEYTDTYGRPLKKVLLLNGPPGSGKTSAAHAIARQAGYDVLEINASDERNAAVVNERVTAAVQSHQAYSKRPICIVADEVEGASEHGFVHALVNILKEDQRALQQQQHRSDSRRKRKPKLLKRPIIAICNDVWAPNLHALRQHAEIVHFQRHSPGRLLKRLETICRDEHIALPARSLAQIADSCDYDMRACLNAIQFGVQYSMDQNRENFELTDWSALAKMQFQAQRPATFQQLESCSDLDKLIASCFTAYPTCSFIDDMMSKPAALGEFLDLADHRASTSEVKAMVAHSFGYFFRSPRLSAAKNSVPVLGGKAFARPPSNYETLKQTKNIVEALLKRSEVAVRRATSINAALTEVVPYAVQLACPQTSLSSKADDKIRLLSIAASLKGLGIGLRTEKQENGSLVHKLDPPVELAVMFDEPTRLLASTWKSMPRSQLHNGFKELEKREETESSEGLPAPIMPQSTLVASDKPSQVKRPRQFGFFGNEIVLSATQVGKEADQKARKVWVQYSEGFSNAVRKSVQWDELFSV